MKYKIDDEYYNVVIEKKNNKNLYIRIKEDLTIYVTTNYFTTKKQIIDVLDRNYKFLTKTIAKRKKDLEHHEHICYLGKEYDLVFSNAFKTVEVTDNKIYAPNEKHYNKWYKDEIKKIFEYHFNLVYNSFNNNIPLPKLRIRNMKTRWGVCNTKDIVVTLNSRLIEYDLKALDYVIVHELSHLIHPNHSKNFWQLVGENCSNYKSIKTYLKE